MNRNLLKTLNVIGFVAMVVVNALAVTLPIAGKSTQELSDQYPNLFVPAGLTFSVWSVIYLLLLGFIVYQLAGKERDAVHARMGLLFFFSSVANVGWIFAWHYEQVVLSLIIMLALLATLIAMYLLLPTRSGVGTPHDGHATTGSRKPVVSEPAGPRTGLWRTLFVSVPISVYLGWITVATIANVTAVLVDAGWNRFGLSEAFWAVAMIGAALLITSLILISRKDILYALVVAWALAGIAIKRADAGFDSPAVFWAAAVAGIVVLCGLAFTAAISLRSIRRGDSRSAA